jgi:ParB family chromosome partitioning protein
MWAFHDRIESQTTEQSCKAEIESFLKHGQLVPVLGRRLQADPDYDIELVYGSRRLFVARHTNKKLLVEVRDVSDRDAIIAMDIENRQRADISPYERGMSYARWVRSGHFASQEDLARALSVSASQVSRLLRLSRLPPVIVNAFSDPSEICEGWGLDIVDALDDVHRRQATVDRARAIAASPERPQAREVYRQLLAASAKGRKVPARAHDEVVKDDNGEPLFRIRQQSSAIALLLPLEKISARILDDIRDAVAGILQTANAQTADRAGCVRSQHGDEEELEADPPRIKESIEHGVRQ